MIRKRWYFVVKKRFIKKLRTKWKFKIKYIVIKIIFIRFVQTTN